MPLKWSFTEEDCYQCMVLSITFSTFHKSDIFFYFEPENKIKLRGNEQQSRWQQGLSSWNYFVLLQTFLGILMSLECFLLFSQLCTMRVIRDKYHPCSEWILWIVVKSILTDVCRNGIIPLITFLSHIDLWIIASPRPPNPSTLQCNISLVSLMCNHDHTEIQILKTKIKINNYPPRCEIIHCVYNYTLCKITQCVKSRNVCNIVHCVKNYTCCVE